MYTFTDLQNMCIEISGLSDSKTLATFKRDLQAGTSRFLAKLGRPIDRMAKYTSSVAGQANYQMPEDALRISSVLYMNGTRLISLNEVGDEHTWQRLNQNTATASQPTHFFALGGDEVGLYPTPKDNGNNNIKLVYEPRHILSTADDVSVGTIALTNGSQIVIGTGTLFQQKMADGSYVLQVTSGEDGAYYRISQYSSATGILLENFYQGISGLTLSYRIGQVSKIPEEFQEAPVDWAMWRHYLGKNEMDNAMLYQKSWTSSLEDAEKTYGMATGNQIVYAAAGTKTSNPLTDTYENLIKI